MGSKERVKEFLNGHKRYLKGVVQVHQTILE